MINEPSHPMHSLKSQSSIYPRIILKKGREESVLRFHPWIFSGAIQSVSEPLVSGSIVEVYAYDKKFLGTGHYEKSSLSVKLFSFKKGLADQNFWQTKLVAAMRLRQELGLTRQESTNAYRLVFTEGDGLPGLIIDYYNGVAVVQAQSQGMYNARHQLTTGLVNLYGDTLETVYDKSHEGFSDKTTESSQEVRYLHGRADAPVTISEHGHKFLVDFIKGQKTGFFLDQRENRQLLKHYAPGKRMLNLFSYSGGFSVYGLAGGALEVVSVDSAASAIVLANQNVQLNGFNHDVHKGVCADVKDYVQQMDQEFDLVVLDPPAFAKHKDSRHNAMLGYKYLNAAVLKKIKTGGILFTFSCSQVVGTDLFESTILTAGIEAGRNVRILHRLNQPPDHPVSIFHPEGLYLKGLVLYVE